MNNENEVEIDVPEENKYAGLELPVAVVEKTLPLEKRSLQGGNPITAAQAKVDAVANLTMSAYQRAATLKLTKEQSDSLQSDFPDEAFKTGAAGKENLLYLEHAYLRDRFNQVFGLGGWAIVPRNRWSEHFQTVKGTKGERVYVEAMLVVDGAFVGEAVGDMSYYPGNESTNYGDAVEGAKTAAFRRCAKEFGVGLQAWKKDWCDSWFKRRNVPRGTIQPVQKPKSEPAPVLTGAKIIASSVPFKTMAKPEPAPAVSKLDKFIAETQKAGYPTEQLQQFCIDLAWLLPNASLSELEDRFLPKTVGDFRAFKSCMDNWIAKGDTVQPYDCPIPDPAEKAKVSRGTTLDNVVGAAGEDWYDVIVPIPRKGMKRDEYLKNPDTIGSLYEDRKADETARKRLWGLRKGGEECGWVPKPREYNGKTYQPSDADKLFYSALKQYADWYDENHEEKD